MGGMNFYAYCGNNPVNLIDAFGLCPKAPPGVDINKNIQIAFSHYGDIDWFYEQVQNNGLWDYKQNGDEYQDFGNFNYGATGKALGIPENVLQRAAGWAQEKAGTSRPEWGKWYKSYPYGDDPRDQKMIKKGFKYYNGL